MIINTIMSEQLCKKHQKIHSVYDLNIHSFICERCALFDPYHRHHSFIQADTLHNYVQQLLDKFQHKFKELSIRQNSQKQIIGWKQFQQQFNKIMQERNAAINDIYDEKIKEIQKERDTKLDTMRKEISKICEDSKNSMISLLSEPYNKIRDVKVKVEELYKIGQMNEVCKLLHDGKLTQQIQYISRELSILSLELTHKLKQFTYTDDFPLKFQKKISAAEEMLMNDLATSRNSIFNISLQSFRQKKTSYKSICKTQNTNKNNSRCITERPILHKKSKLSQTLVSIDCTKSQTSAISNVKIVTSKADIKNLLIKNTVKCVNISQLGMNDREAIEAVKKCTSNSFVTKIDLSGNLLTHKFVTLLKRQKISKYLKVIVVKGIKLTDTREMKKEGITLDSNGRIQISDITLQS